MMLKERLTIDQRIDLVCAVNRLHLIQSGFGERAADELTRQLRTAMQHQAKEGK